MMNVYDLSRDQLTELKQNYMCQLDQEGTFGEVVFGDASIEGISWEALADADELIPDDLIFEHYDGIVFSDDDFVCSCEPVLLKGVYLV